MKTIELTKGKVALVDDEDYDLLRRYRWIAYKKHNTWYARCSVEFPSENGKRQRISVHMHQQVLLWFEGVDHVNRNGLDNRRENLRRASAGENARNIAKKDGTSRFMGVCWHPAKEKWMASMSLNGRCKYLGYFDDEEDAAHAYDDAVQKVHPGFAQLNFPAIARTRFQSKTE